MFGNFAGKLIYGVEMVLDKASQSRVENEMKQTAKKVETDYKAVYEKLKRVTGSEIEAKTLTNALARSKKEGRRIGAEHPAYMPEAELQDEMQMMKDLEGMMQKDKSKSAGIVNDWEKNRGFSIDELMQGEGANVPYEMNAPGKVNVPPEMNTLGKGSGIEGLTNSIQNLLGGIGGGTGAEAGGAGGAGGLAGAGLAGAAGGAVVGVLMKIEDIVKTGIDMFKQVVQIMRDASPVFDSMLKIMNKAFMLALMPIATVIGMILKPIAINMMRSATENLKIMKDQIAKGVDPFTVLTTMGEGFTMTVIPAAIEAFTVIALALVPAGIGILMGILPAILTLIDTVLTSFITKFSDVQTGLGKATWDLIITYIGNVMTEIGKITLLLIPAIDAVFQGLIPTVTAFFVEILQLMIPSILDAANTIITTIPTFLTENAQKFVDAFATIGVGIITSMATWLTENSSTFVNAISGVGMEIIKAIPDWLTTNSGAFVDAIGQIGLQVVGTIPAWFTANSDNILGVFWSIANSITNAIPSWLSSKDPVDGTTLTDKIVGIFGTVGTSVINSIPSWLNTADLAGQSPLTKILDALSGVGSALVASVPGWFSDSTNQATFKTALESIAQGVISAIPQMIIDALNKLNPITHLFAEGGVVTKPTLGIVGEAGPEAIIPLSELGDVTSQISGGTIDVPSIGAIASNSGLSKEVNIYINIGGNVYGVNDLEKTVADGFRKAMYSYNWRA